VFEAGSYGEAKVVAELADMTHRTWVVADADGALVAYAHVGPCKLPHPEVRAGDIELYQLYLLRGVQGAGLGRRLLDVVLDHCERLGGPVWLGVWSGNERARRVYTARGFVDVGTYQFRVGDWLDDEVIMRRGAARV
jgi:GNAT superfamily N-acetyltransferase